MIGGVMASSINEDISMKGTHVNNQVPEGNDHLTYQGIADCFTGALPAEQLRLLQRHCIQCADCRERLTLVMEALQPDDQIDHSPEFAELLRSGELAAEK